MIKRIGILTSGGDAPGMNAAIRAVVRSALSYGLEPYGIYNGYRGLIQNEIVPMDRSSVSDIVNRGGTILKTARLPEFCEKEIQLKAVEILQRQGIEALVVIGGDGTYRGAKALSELGINCVALPGTIDNDIGSTDYTIGFDTALNTIIDAVDKIRDTTESHSRCSIVEVMGNHCGDLALYSGIAEGAEIIITPDFRMSDEELFSTLRKMREKDVNRRAIVIVSEKIYPDIQGFAKKVEKETGFNTRATTLGYIQRGGSPSTFDRVLAGRMGAYAVDQLIAGKGGICIGVRGNTLVDYEISKALAMKKKRDDSMITIVKQINK
jgi:6-phosphofructokinase 1